MSARIPTWQERVTGCGKVEGGHHGGGPCCGEQWYSGRHFCVACQGKARDAEIAELRAALESLQGVAVPAEQKPVAWMVDFNRLGGTQIERTFYWKDTEMLQGHREAGHVVTALYDAPQPPAVKEAEPKEQS